MTSFPTISLPQDNERQFHIALLIRYLIQKGMTQIVQGQQHVALTEHTKPNSLDFFLRSQFAQERDTAQATQRVIEQIISTGLFRGVADIRCPDTGRLCKGIEVIKVGEV